MYFTEFVRREGGYDLSELGERVVEGLGALAFADVGDDALVLELLEALRRGGTLLGGAATVAGAPRDLFASLARGGARGGARVRPAVAEATGKCAFTGGVVVAGERG